ncbi:RNA polymerase-associated protein RapA [Seminibacterium arietis]|uniref:RNA polymerase-associated protein RapA n=1 Tax=Seminibacterium arietis TaxID=1173502 RepID=A0ABW3I927_9PAST
MSFAIGQRWISESESSLGLGIITALDLRKVTISFPATEEVRIYAIENAPLARVRFQQGDKICHKTGWQGEVKEIMEQKSLLFYLVENVQLGEQIPVCETELAHHISFSKPQERLFSAQIDRSDHFALRYQALKHQQAQFQSPLRGLRGTRAGLIPHQLHIAKEVGQRVAPRVLLADEVGLGKTIEAGMILQQQIFSEKVQRAVIIVPESLQHQWLVEMLRRFNLHFALFDEERCSDFDSQNESAVEIQKINPFDTENFILCSLDWLISKPNRANQLHQCDFDLLIVDEAHHLQWSPQQASPEYAFIKSLAHKIPAVLLLTATPEQLGMESHFARLHLLDPDRFYDYAAFIEEQKHYRPVANAVQTLLTDKWLNNDEQNQLTELLSEQNIEPMLKAINSDAYQEQRDLARQELIDNLLDRHGTSRILFRNTRQGVKGFPRRTYHQINLNLPDQYQNAAKVLNMFGDHQPMDLFYPEKMFQKVNQDASWWDFDPRVEWLITFLRNHTDEKVLVICHQATTAIQLEQALREKEGIRSAVFHEKMTIVERDRASAYFAQQENGAQILLTSSIGSEGRNFQFACHLVLFNLPDNVDLLEQCIGRLDRIGQRRDIEIHVPCFTNTPQILLARWYHEGLNAFEETCPMGATLFAKLGNELQQFLQNATALCESKQQDFKAFIERTAKDRLMLKTELEQGRDRLLELNSNGGEQAQQLAEKISVEDGNDELINFTLNLFDIIGVEQEDLGEKSIVIHPTGTMLVPDFPGLKEEGITLTFDRQLALAREELEFFTWDHPMIRNGIDLITSGDIGKSAVALLTNNNLPAGTVLLELIFVVETQAPHGLHLTRFLPPTPVRLLLDAKGNNLAEQVSFAKLQRQLKPIGKNMANKVVKMLRPSIEQLLLKAEGQAKSSAQQVILQAQALADQQLNAEINRLIALRALNKNIRQTEIDTLENQLSLSLQQITQATWRLDSLRLIISNKE